MVLLPLPQWFESKPLITKPEGRRSYRRAWSHRPRLECLEDRLSPATHTWTGASSNLWSDGKNWTGGAPTADTSADLVFPPGASNLTNTNDITNLIFASITYTGSGYTTTGNRVSISFNAQGLGQTITTDPT